MTTDEARQELLDSITQPQWMMIKLFMSVIAKAWSVFSGTLTPRQKELLKIIGDDRRVSETINDIERMTSK